MRNKALKYGLIGFGIILLMLLIFLAVRVIGFYNAIHTDSQGTENSNQEVKEKMDYTVLILGYGGGTHDGANLTDTIMVANINLEKKHVVLVSIPRDVWVNVPTKSSDFHSKINAIYQMALFPKNYPDVDSSYYSDKNPSGLIKKVIFDITGMKIDAYVSVDFQGFIKAINTLGGIDVQVQKTFTDYEYPLEGKETDLCERDEEFKAIEPILNNEMSPEDQTKLFEEKPELKTFFTDIEDNPPIAFPCRYEELHFEQGIAKMDGITALKYARSRHALEDGGDFNRAKRQQNVLEAVKSKVLGIGFIPKIIPLLSDLENHVNTDLPLTEINKLLLEAPNADRYTVETLVLTDEFLTDGYSDYGGYIVYPKEGIDDWDRVKTAVQMMTGNITPTPSISVPIMQ